MIANTVTFGASDKPLPGAELEKNGLVQFPTVMGGIVPVVNLDGITPGQIVLDGPTIAKIYLGEITAWNDAAIQKLNPQLKLPSDAIAVVYRSDGSGTTFVWTNYLSKVSPDFKSKIGSNTSVQFPAGIGAKGNEGVANNVMQTKGAIGYVEYAYAKQNKLSYTKMINKDGKTVAPVKEAFQAAAANADWASAPGMGVILTDEPGEASWPITNPTFILMHKKATDAVAAKEALKFFDWAYANGDKMAEELDYVPLPDNVVLWSRRAGLKSPAMTTSRFSLRTNVRGAEAPSGASSLSRRTPSIWSHDWEPGRWQISWLIYALNRRRTRLRGGSSWKRSGAAIGFSAPSRSYPHFSFWLCSEPFSSH